MFPVDQNGDDARQAFAAATTHTHAVRYDSSAEHGVVAERFSDGFREFLGDDPEPATRSATVLATSKQEERVLPSRQLGVNSYISTLVSFEEPTRIVRIVGHYPIEIVGLPPDQ